MRFLFLTLLSLNSSYGIYEVVEEFHAAKTQKSEEEFLNKYGSSAEPSVLAYVCALEMKQAEYSFNPMTKLKIFNHSKKKLDSLIELNPSNIHLRYIRFVLQEKAPSLLGYKDNIEQDKKFLKQLLDVSDDTDFLDIYIYNNTSI